MIYRGFDIEGAKGNYKVRDGEALLASGIATEDAAMDWVDQFKRDTAKRS